MDKEPFGVRATAMRDAPCRVTATLLRREADREDAVAEAIAKALVKLPVCPLKTTDMYQYAHGRRL